LDRVRGIDGAGRFTSGASADSIKRYRWRAAVARIAVGRWYYSSMTASQLQHYVPRFVLRRFAAASKDTVHVYDKHTAKTFVACTRKVAAENGLYDFEFDGEGLTLESALAEIEGRAAHHIQQILEDERLHPSNPLERGELARFFAIQVVRTPAHMEMWRELDTRMEAWLRHEGMRESFFAFDARFGSRENARRAVVARSLVSAPESFGPAFASKDWVLMRTAAPSPYLIGDHPLVMHNSRDHGPRGNLGLNVLGIEIYFPLSPRLAMGMMCETHARDFWEALRHLNKRELNHPDLQKGLSIARDFIRVVETGEPARMDSENVEFLNSLQVARAERFLFSSDGDFSIAEKMIYQHPSLRHGPRIEEATGKF
jgi:Protein of unknown function (DUF4238)